MNRQPSWIPLAIAVPASGALVIEYRETAP
jgi:hypothetical protein